ncbi:phage integrase family site-specific recombinase [Cellulophaga phage phi46:1]|uniref:phage integrase family site-specific recombinase n=1 Tax=Cellulophaga phage phi46:1 TaxID=1327974 RepID=UPI000351FA04|nr:phage integrase family site-specific recombinase [Cellulophaga phage phi46:1]AGO47834.1 phage integrase family site-specific recombinase [Cellulophaga phage phi46:1]
MILLQNGCTCSELKVYPPEWISGGLKTLNKKWYIQYRFKDPRYLDKFPSGKLVIIKGMNKFKTLDERREAAKAILENELFMLKDEGFNPITKTFEFSKDNTEEIDENSRIIDALKYATQKIDVAKKTKQDIENVLDFFIDSINYENLHILKISEVEKKHVYRILERTKENRNYSNNRYNKMRAYIVMIFKKLLDLDIIKFNFVPAIPKLKTESKLRETLTDDELEKIKAHLKENYYTFYRYVEIFFHSGARSTELLTIQRKDVDLKNQVYTVRILKRKQVTQELRAINNNVLPLWVELCQDATPDDFLFSKGLKAGAVQIDAWQISKRWREHVKRKLNITKDFYALKHLHTVKVIEAHSRELGASINGHKSNAMNDKHYDVMRELRLLQAAKEINVEL